MGLQQEKRPIMRTTVPRRSLVLHALQSSICPQAYQVGAVIIPSLQMKELRFMEMN